MQATVISRGESCSANLTSSFVISSELLTSPPKILAIFSVNKSIADDTTAAGVVFVAKAR